MPRAEVDARFAARDVLMVLVVQAGPETATQAP